MVCFLAQNGWTTRLRQMFLPIVICAATINFTDAQSQTGGVVKNIVQRQVAPDLYFVYDQYLSVRNVMALSTSSGDAGVVLIQHLRGEMLDDVCYLVLAPSKLASTVESQNVR